ncbi:hypothetical protein BSF42_14960 [Flavobacterium sp. ACN6]|nr:hypothetical protein BSF42_14960 [Flavobacterium sp. ACN6]
MEYFDIEKYKDWESDTEWNSNEIVKFLKKGNDRVEIYFYKKGIQVRLKNTQNYYSTVKTYSYKNKLLQGVSHEFYAIDIGIYREYDEIGKLGREIDYDKPYKFSIKQLIEKVKKECNVDLEKKIQNTWAKRKVDQNLKKPFYEVSLGSKEIPGQQEYILIDGTTGETLFETIYYTKGDIETMNPFDQYITKLKKEEEEDNSYFKNYKGKNYTKKEWKEFEEEWYKNYKENKDKGFWDDIFKKPGKK